MMMMSDDDDEEADNGSNDYNNINDKRNAVFQN